MTVHPGFGGQEFIAATMDKVCRRRRGYDPRTVGTYHIEVDGGIKEDTARRSRKEHGANVLVAGTSVFKAGDAAAAILKLRGGEDASL